MIQKLFAIYDSKAELYKGPLPNRTSGEAAREFLAAVNNPDSLLSKHPADFHLFEIGTYDDVEGLVTPHPVKINLGCALEYVDKAKDPFDPRQVSNIERASVQ